MATYKTKKPYMYGTGRRKSSVARVHLIPNGSGVITINGRDIDDYFRHRRQGRHRGHRLRRRRVRPGRRHPPRHRPRPAGRRRELPRRSEGRRFPDPRPAHERAQEVRPQGRPPRSSVLEALIKSIKTSKPWNLNDSRVFLFYEVYRGLFFLIPFYTG